MEIIHQIIYEKAVELQVFNHAEYNEMVYFIEKINDNDLIWVIMSI